MIKLIKIIPIEETYLRVFEKPPKVRFTRQVIAFNYAALSPFPGGAHLSYQSADSIFVWYLKEPPETGLKVNIPEAYLVWRFFKDRTDAIIMIPRNGMLSLLVIKGGVLRAQLTSGGTAGEAQQLDLVKREFSLQDVEVIRLEPTATFKVRPRDFVAFADFSFRPAHLIEQAVALAKAPLIAVLLITSGFYIYQENRLDSLFAGKTKYLAALKRENGDMQSSLEDVRDKASYWRNFISREQAYPDYYQSLSALTGIVQRHGGYLNTVEFSENRFTLWIGIKSSEAQIIKELIATGLFQEVKLLSSAKDSARPDFYIYNLSIILRPAAAKVSS